MNELYLVENFLKNLRIDYIYGNSLKTQIILKDYIESENLKKIVVFCSENNFNLFNGLISGLTIIKKNK